MTAFDRAWTIVKAVDYPEVLAVTHAGMGGVEQGGKLAGIPTAYSGEMWRPALKVNAANHPEGVHDLVEFGKGEYGSVPAVAGRILDAVAGRKYHLHGSPPCKDFSRANPTRKHDMSQIIWWYNLLNHLKSGDHPPVSWSMEEVRDVLKPIRESPHLSARFKSVASKMPILSAREFGAPQHRNRAFFGEGWEAEPTHSKEDFRSISDVLPHLADEWIAAEANRQSQIEHLQSGGRIGSEALDFLSKPSLALSGAVNPGKISAKWPEGVPQNKASFGFQHLVPLDRQSHSITHHPPALTHTRFLDPKEVLEMMRFPKDYDISQAGSRADLHEMLGNAVVPPVFGHGVLGGRR